jgi:hypothetical protein
MNGNSDRAPKHHHLPDPWLFDSEALLRELARCRETALQIPVTNPNALLWTDVGLVRWRWFVVSRRCVSANSERINVGIARARNQRHHHCREP